LIFRAKRCILSGSAGCPQVLLDILTINNGQQEKLLVGFERSLRVVGRI
jgi:hypothetical protein